MDLHNGIPCKWDGGETIDSSRLPSRHTPIQSVGQIRTALKEDLHCTSAELVYGTTLRLPGEFFTPTQNPLNPPTYVSQLKSFLQLLRATPPRMAQRTVYVDPSLSTCTHVFIRHDATRKPLQQSYNGPYEVLKREDKHFVVNINGRHDTVSLDRLKPAHCDSSSCTPVPAVEADPQPVCCHPPHDPWQHALDAMFTGHDTSGISFPSRSLGGEYCGGHLTMIHHFILLFCDDLYLSQSSSTWVTTS